MYSVKACPEQTTETGCTDCSKKYIDAIGSPISIYAFNILLLSLFVKGK